MNSFIDASFSDAFLDSDVGHTIGDLIKEAITTGLYPVADPSIISGYDDEFDSNDVDSWRVDPLNCFGVGVGDLLQSGALHRSSLADVQAPSAVPPSDAPDDVPAGTSVEAAPAASES